MKCKIVVDIATQKNPEYDRNQAHKLGRAYKVPPFIPCPRGTVIECPTAWKLVLLGMAIPDDAECQTASEYTEEKFRKWNADYHRFMSGRATGDPRYDAPAPEDSEDLAAEPDQEIEMVED